MGVLSLHRNGFGRFGGHWHRFSPGLAAGAVCVLIAVLAGCGGSGGGSEGAVRSTMHPVTMERKYTVDGAVDFSTFNTVNIQAVTINDKMGGAGGSRVRVSYLHWAVDNDDRNLYIALEWQDATRNNSYDLDQGPTDYDGIRVMFDVNGNGTFDDNEDIRTLIAVADGSLYSDQHRIAAAAATDLIGDGYGKMSYNATSNKYQAELVFPMRQDASGQDGALTSASRINFVIYDHVTPTTGNVGYAYGSTSTTAAWPSLSLNSEVGFSHPTIPAGLGGMVVFVGEQDVPVGGIYTLDPANGTVTEVSIQADLYKDRVAVSHDHASIAFEGVVCDALESATACRQRTGDYEVYRIDLSDNSLTRLTTNNFYDGHPRWSADDKKIIFTSDRNGGKGAVVIMDAVTGVESADLTGVLGDDDRDPDFLPDGRIVFATNRFTAVPPHTAYETRIAVMNSDGSGLLPLTSSDGVSDHLPDGDAAGVVFERFTGDGDPTAVEALVTPWNLSAVQLSGGAESTLLADGWINRQPVLDPSGRYVAFIKNTGYNAVHLVGRDGIQYGRLIPGVTTVRSLDWQ